jgi:hypothetical protein
MAETSSLKWSPRAENTRVDNRSARQNRTIVSKIIPDDFVWTYEALASLRKLVWDDVVKSGQCKLYVLVLTWGRSYPWLKLWWIWGTYT